jgi:hypothetical protein
MTEDRVKEILRGPLYKEYELNYDELRKFLFLTIQYPLDLYCNECNKMSIFHCKSKNDDIWNMIKEQYFILKFKCSRDYITEIMYWFKIITEPFENEPYILIKSGQYPSLSDLENHNINKYSKILKDDLSIFKKGIGLSSHGVGAGAFIYLRMIFENLISSTAKENKIEISPGTKIKNIIDRLKEFLPGFMYENKVIYSLLSNGLHELNEKYCIDNFNLLKETILLILDQKLKLIEEKERINNLNKELNKLNSEVKNRS